MQNAEFEQLYDEIERLDMLLTSFYIRTMARSDMPDSEREYYADVINASGMLRDAAHKLEEHLVWD